MNNPRPHHIVQFRAVQSPQWAVKLRTKKTGSAYPQNRKKLPKVRRHDISPVSRILSLTSNVFFLSLFWLSVFLPACTYIQWVVWGMEWHLVKKKAEKLSFKSSKKKSLNLLLHVELLCYRWKHLQTLWAVRRTTTQIAIIIKAF